MIEVSLLLPLVEAIEACSEREEENLRKALNMLATGYPDLLRSSEEANAARSPSKIDAVFRNVKRRFDEIEASARQIEEFEIPYLHHIRINCSNGRVHIGHGNRSALLFPS
ncbi:hypothetical protein [Brucella anthropi]|uniref:Uncharacterized protein n=1 Tax=Brucella anthropi TaxID=529 RepID=A0A6L3Z8E6_BRUAN|nr:hypothetical protein [Brucella anthropi]KAB2772424.1 hypothetical protein F9L04_06795 [Brucella anthropi]UVV69946.1 hypothetical protein NW321_15340 [Brucella anthropi]